MLYRVIQKKFFHKSEEKMKMILQKDENLVSGGPIKGSFGSRTLRETRFFASQT